MASSSSDQNRKTNKFGIVIRDEDQLDQFIEFFTEYHYMAVISPLHNEDHWTKTDIERFIRNNEEKHGITVDRTAETFEVPGKKFKVVNGKRVREMITVRIPTVGMHKLNHRHAMIKLIHANAQSLVVLPEPQADNKAKKYKDSPEHNHTILLIIKLCQVSRINGNPPAVVRREGLRKEGLFYTITNSSRSST